MLHIKINMFCLGFMASIRTTAAFNGTKPLILEMKLQGFNHLSERPLDSLIESIFRIF